MEEALRKFGASSSGRLATSSQDTVRLSNWD